MSVSLKEKGWCSQGKVVRGGLCAPKATVISDPIVRAQAERIAASPVVIDSYVLFEFQVKRVLVVEYDEERKLSVQFTEVSKNTIEKGENDVSNKYV
jgi:hypothetical protein